MVFVIKRVADHETLGHGFICGVSRLEMLSKEDCHNLFVCLLTVNVLLTVLWSSLMVLRKFCPLCYKSAMIPRRLRINFHLYFQSLRKFP